MGQGPCDIDQPTWRGRDCAPSKRTKEARPSDDTFMLQKHRAFLHRQYPTLPTGTDQPDGSIIVGHWRRVANFSHEYFMRSASSRQTAQRYISSDILRGHTVCAKSLSPRPTLAVLHTPPLLDIPVSAVTLFQRMRTIESPILFLCLQRSRYVDKYAQFSHIYALLSPRWRLSETVSAS